MESNRGNADPEGNSQEEPADFVHKTRELFFTVLNEYIITYTRHAMNNAGHQVVHLLCLDSPSSYSAISGLPAWCQINPDTCFLSLRGARRDHPQNYYSHTGEGGRRQGGDHRLRSGSSADRSGCRDANEVRWFQIESPLYYRLSATPVRSNRRQLYAQKCSLLAAAVRQFFTDLRALLYKKKTNSVIIIVQK